MVAVDVNMSVFIGVLTSVSVPIFFAMALFAPATSYRSFDDLELLVRAPRISSCWRASSHAASTRRDFSFPDSDWFKADFAELADVDEIAFALEALMGPGARPVVRAWSDAQLTAT